jgi:hypothetical protein
LVTVAVSVFSGAGAATPLVAQTSASIQLASVLLFQTRSAALAGRSIDAMHAHTYEIRFIVDQLLCPGHAAKDVFFEKSKPPLP